MVWMLAEAVLAIGAGVVARSVVLTAFGFDSLIELISGGLLLWRLGVEAGGATADRVERVEGRAEWLSAALLGLLCVYVLATSVAGLRAGLRPESSVVGLLVAAAALVIMPLLAVAKRRVNERLQSSALRADIAETVTCAYMAGVTLLGVGAHALLGWWWLDYLAALALLVWLVPETREAWLAARGGDPDSG